MEELSIKECILLIFAMISLYRIILKIQVFSFSLVMDRRKVLEEYIVLRSKNEIAEVSMIVLVRIDNHLPRNTFVT